MKTVIHFFFLLTIFTSLPVWALSTDEVDKLIGEALYIEFCHTGRLVSMDCGAYPSNVVDLGKGNFKITVEYGDFASPEQTGHVIYNQNTGTITRQARPLSDREGLEKTLQEKFCQQNPTCKIGITRIEDLDATLGYGITHGLFRITITHGDFNDPNRTGYAICTYDEKTGAIHITQAAHPSATCTDS